MWLTHCLPHFVIFSLLLEVRKNISSIMHCMFVRRSDGRLAGRMVGLSLQCSYWTTFFNKYIPILVAYLFFLLMIKEYVLYHIFIWRGQWTSTCCRNWIYIFFLHILWLVYLTIIPALPILFADWSLNRSK